MSSARRLVCLAPAAPPRFEVRDAALPAPGKNEVLVEQVASSINPIDAKRASGYGARLLSLRGAGKFPLVLGNDVAGIVRALGPGVSGLAVGTRVVGLMPTGAAGAHASHVVVPAQWVRPVIAGTKLLELAALPYSFTTMWLSLRAAGLNGSNARGRQVLVNGAAGGLGRMALFVLRGWGAHVTAVDSAERLPDCGALGAGVLVPRGADALQRLPDDFHAVLNFGSWQDDADLSARLGLDALGHSTTVHPLLAEFDAHGWLGGAWRSWKLRQQARQRVAARARSARYAWVVFQPDERALKAMLACHAAGLRLPLGWTGDMEQAAAGFEHVRSAAPGRAVLRLEASASASTPVARDESEAATAAA